MIEIFLIITSIESNMSLEFVLKQGLGIRASSPIKHIKQKLEVFSGKKFSNNFKIELLFHQGNVMSNIFNNLNSENRLIYSLHVSESISPDLVEFDDFGEFEIGGSVLSYFLSLSKH